MTLLLSLNAPAFAKPFLRVDIRNGQKVPSDFSVCGKTSARCLVFVEVSSWDGFGAEFKARTDRRGHFSVPISIEGRTVTTHVDIVVRSIDPRDQSLKEVSRYVIIKRER